MLQMDRPDCPHCGTNSYEGRGCQMGVGTVDHVACKKCKGGMTYIYRYGRSVFVFDKAPPNPNDEMEYGRDKVIEWGLETRQRRCRFIDTMIWPWLNSNRKNHDDGVKTPMAIPPGFDGRDTILFIEPEEKKFVRVRPEDSMLLPLVDDDQRAQHRKTWEGLAAFLDFDAKPIKNRYFDDRDNNYPWYRVDIGDDILIFGPRKNVEVVEIICGKRPIDATAIKAAMRNENDTFTVKGPVERAMAMEIHAWSYPKLVEFLLLARRALLGYERPAE